ncbi:MAG TPA: serine hydrolase domain-containing protein [Thermomicrobiales bacterium]|nr:serine hydrolase domain-containing protein [Thermomicrobiales bacterium]
MPTSPSAPRRMSRRTAVRAGAAGILATTSTVLSAPTSGLAARQSATPAADPGEAIIGIAEDAMDEMDLRAVLLRVTIDGEEIVHGALGESLTGQPATPDMHIRNGAVAITYVSTALLRLVDDGVLALDDTIGAWLPDLPDADRVTPRMLANMTAGYPDYVPNPSFSQAFYADPFRSWTPEELIEFSLSTPRAFAPGENWDYSHTNYAILGLVLEAATGEPLDLLLRSLVLNPLGLANTASEETAWMPEPILHAYSSERREVLGIPEGTPFYEESTFWNPSWTLARGAVQYTTVADMATSFEAIGSGELLSETSYGELTSTALLGFGEPLEGCPACHTLDNAYLYGLGIILSGGWLMQNPLFGGYASTVAYQPDARIAIAVATTFEEESFTEDGSYRFGKSGQAIATRIGQLLHPSSPPLLG